MAKKTDPDDRTVRIEQCNPCGSTVLVDGVGPVSAGMTIAVPEEQAERLLRSPKTWRRAEKSTPTASNKTKK